MFTLRKGDEKPSTARKQKAGRCLVILGVLVAGWLAFVSHSIWHFGYYDNAEAADCIIVLGAAVSGNQPSPVFEERLKHGVHLYRRGLAGKLIFTGGVGDGQTSAEGDVGESFALSEGVPAHALLKETVSRTTRQNLEEAKKVMRAEGLRSAIIVSDPLHLKRASLMAKDLGLNAVTSPTPTSRYRSFRMRFEFLLREVYFVHHYVIFRR